MIRLMKREELSEAVGRQLFAEEGAANVYAVLDGASVPGLLERLYTLEPEFECLYRGELEPDMAEVAPYLVCLRPDAEFTAWLLAEGWGRSWGVFVASEADMRAVRRHLRAFLVVYGPDGRPLYFRYYDPRVLRLYLPTCEPAELSTVFGPVGAYVLEGEAPDTLLRFQFADGRLLRQEVPLVDAK